MSLLLRLTLFICLADFNTRSKLVNIYIFASPFAVTLPASHLFLAGKRCLACPTHLFFSPASFTLSFLPHSPSPPKLLWNKHINNKGISILPPWDTVLLFCVVVKHGHAPTNWLTTHTRFKSSTFLPSVQASPSPPYSLPCTRKLTLTFPRHNSF